MPTLLQQGLPALAIAYISVAGLACEGAPARSKPWRHDRARPAPPDRPQPVAAAERDELEHLRRRASTLRVHLPSDPRHLNPLAPPTLWGRRITRPTVYESLLRYAPPDEAGGVGGYEPGLAAAWRVGAGGREIWVELREDVSFHDGSRMVAADVQFSVDSARQPGAEAAELPELLRDVAAVEIVSPSAVRVRLHRPSGYALRALAEVPIVPAAVYRRRVVAARGPVVGTGPFRLDSWTEAGIALARFDGYWGAPPALERIEFALDLDAASALTAARRGELDIVPALIPSHYPEQAEAPGIAGVFSPLRLHPVVLRYVALGQRRPPLDDPRVRRAVALSIDRAALIREAYDDLARAAAGPVWPGGPGDGREPPAPGFEPATAAALLDAAGWRDDNGDGTRERGGERLQVAMLALTDSEGADREAVKLALSQAGFFVEERRGSAAVLANRLRVGDFGIALVEWSSLADTDLAPLVSSRGADNFGGFADPRVDAALDALRLAADPAARRPLIDALGALLAEATPFAPLVVPEPYGLVHRRVRGVRVWDGWIDLVGLSLAREP
jgi:peptide/nickel transport system substrate-binding protein